MPIRKQNVVSMWCLRFLALLLLLIAVCPHTYCYKPSLNPDQIEKRIDQANLSAEEATELADYAQSNPGNARAHFLLGRYYSYYNFGEMAIAEFKDALKIDHRRPEIWIALANEQYRHKKLPACKTTLDKALALFPNNPRLLASRGIFYLRQNNFDQAEHDLGRAQALKSDDAEILTARSQLFLKLGNPLKALTLADRALAVKKDFVAGYLARGQALILLGKRRQALLPLGAGFHIYPFDPELALLYLNECRTQSRYLEAFKAALAVMGVDVNKDELLGQDKDVVIDIINQFQPDGRLSPKLLECINWVSTKLQGTGHQGKYLFCLGDIYDRFGKPSIAMQFYRQGLTIEPTFPRAWLRLGEDLEQAYRYNEALACYEKAYALTKDDPEIPERLNKLKSCLDNDWAWQFKQFILKIFGGKDKQCFQTF